MYQKERLQRIHDSVAMLHHCLAVDMRVGFEQLAGPAASLAELAAASGNDEIKGHVLELALGHRDAAMSCAQLGEALGAVLAELATLELDAQDAETHALAHAV
jgi:hypothetical protein